MNERIRALAEQAGWMMSDEVEGFNTRLEKFAELIVRECAGACLHDDWEDPRWGRFYANKIREHFAIR